jgi:hypothetical protein
LKALIILLLWAVLLVFCWPIALLILILWPVILLSIPFKIVAIFANALLASEINPVFAGKIPGYGRKVEIRD